MSSIKRRLAVGVTAVAAATVMATGAAVAASAGVTGTTSTQDGMAGYFGNTLGVNYKSVIGTFDLNAAAENIGTTTSLASPHGALGEQLCANSGGSSGEAAELGLTYNGQNAAAQGTFSVDYALGWLPKAPNADPCLNGILHNGNRLHPLMSNIPVGDTVTLLEYTGRYGVWFAGQDNATGRSFEDWASCGGYFTHNSHWQNWRWHWYGCPRWNEPGAGVQQNLTLLGGQATSDLLDVSAVYVDRHETASPGTPLGQLNATAVYSSGTGNAPYLVGPAKSVTTGPNGEGCTGPTQFGPLATGGSSFSICAATPIGA